MVNESRPSSTIEVESVNGSQSVSVVVWEIPNATILTTHGSLDNVQTKLMTIQAEAGQGDSKVE